METYQALPACPKHSQVTEAVFVDATIWHLAGEYKTNNCVWQMN